MKLGLEYESDYVGDNGTLSLFSLSPEKKPAGNTVYN